MADRHLPVRPDLEQLRRQAKELLRALRRGRPEAVAELRRHHPAPPPPAAAKLADAQLALARAYGVASWPRLVVACRLVDAIWRDDLEAVRAIVRRRPELLDEPARGAPSHWGPPMSYAANLGRDRLIAMLRELGARDLDHAFDRACLQGRIQTARHLLAMGAQPAPGAVMGPCETLNADGLGFLLDLGVELADPHGDRLAPLALVLQTYSRYPAGKHRCLEVLASHGLELPETAPMAIHRGSRERLEAQLERDPALLARTFRHDEIWPRALGCSADESLALHGTPLAGGTLLHLCVDYDELELATCLLSRGADPNARAEVDEQGFGGHTPLFNAVVSQAARNGRDDRFAGLLLDRGADPRARASLRKRLRFVDDETTHEYPNVTPLEWGERFHDPEWVSRSAMRAIAERLRD